MSLFDDLVSAIFPFALSFLGKVGDEQIDGATLNADQRRAVFTGYIALKVWGTKIVGDSGNTYDDAAVKEAITLAEDTLTEAGIAIPAIPVFVDGESA